MIVHLLYVLTPRGLMMFHLTIGIYLTHVIFEVLRTQGFRGGPSILEMLAINLHP